MNRINSYMKRIQKIILYTLIVYSMIGFLVVPRILKHQLTTIIQEETNSKLSLGNISFNPFTFSLKISNAKLKTLDAKQLLSLKSILINLEPSSLIEKTVHVKNFILEEPEITLVYNKDKSLNFSKLIIEDPVTKEQNTTQKISLPRIVLDNVAFNKGTLNYQDFSNKSEFNFSFQDIGFNLNNLDTQNLSSSDAKLRFYSTLEDGGFIDLKTNIVELEPFTIEGSIDFQASKLYTQWRYIKDKLNLEVADGKLSLRAQYNLNLDDLNNTTIYNAHASLENLRIKPKGNQKDILNLKSLEIKNGFIKPFKKKIEVDEIGLNSLYVDISRDARGNINWKQYIKTKFTNTKKNSSVASKESSDDWNIVVNNIALEKIKANFNDKAISPRVNSKLNELNIYAQNFILTNTKPLSYQINMRLNDILECNTNGIITDKFSNLNTYIKCNNIDIVHYQPYIDKIARKALKVYDIKLNKANINFDANVSVRDISSKAVVNIDNANVNLKNLILNKRSTQERLIKLHDLDISGVNLNTKEKDVLIEEVRFKKFDISTKRLKSNTLNIQNLIVPRTKKAYSKQQKIKIKHKVNKPKEYKILLKHFALDSSAINFKDEFLSPSVKNKIDKISVTADNISSEKNSFFTYNLSLRVNSKGFVKSQGKLKHTPLEQKGTFTIEKISLKELTPYIQEHTYLRIDDGFISLKTKTRYKKSKKSSDIKIYGSLKANELFISDDRDKSVLFSLGNASLNNFSFEMFPNQLFINEADINSFYINAIVDENKTINFATLIKKKDEVIDHEKAPVIKEETEIFPVKVMKMNVALGSATFADKSLPIDFKTNIHDINGVAYLLSNNNIEISYFNVDGEVNKYAATNLEGSITLGDPKSYTDMNLNFENLALNPFSGYSASFAGYKIDNGKLFLDLGYNIIDSKLLGKNSIIVKKMKLGEKYTDNNTTSLPLGLAIALLEDSNGVINIDIPIQGDVNNPDFKYGAIVFKAFVNLIIKAVASPFKFLGSMIGISSDDLAFVEFHPGKYTIRPPQKEKLDSIVNIMQKRPKISLVIKGTYDIEADKKALQQNKLIALAMSKSKIKNTKYSKKMLTTDLLEAIYKDLKGNDKLKKIKNTLKEKYNTKLFERKYASSLFDECTKVQPFSIDEVKKLATLRSIAIKEYLVNEKKIQKARIKELNIIMANDKDNKNIKTELNILPSYNKLKHTSD